MVVSKQPWAENLTALLDRRGQGWSIENVGKTPKRYDIARGGQSTTPSSGHPSYSCLRRNDGRGRSCFCVFYSFSQVFKKPTPESLVWGQAARGTAPAPPAQNRRSDGSPAPRGFETAVSEGSQAVPRGWPSPASACRGRRHSCATR